MPATWKTVRVFISSTFRDMQAERDHLMRERRHFYLPDTRQLKHIKRDVNAAATPCNGGW